MKIKVITVSLILSALIAVGFTTAICVGAKNIPLDTIWLSITDYNPDIIDMQLIRDVRIPRAVCTILVGAFLGVAGAAMQGVTRNPIAEPTIMGISQGATLTVTIAVVMSVGGGMLGKSLAALAGAFVSGMLVLLFSIQSARNMSLSRLLLAGTAIGTFFISLSTMIAMIRNRSWDVAFWVAGGFRTAEWRQVWMLAAGGIIFMLILLLLSGRINIVNLGEDIAIGLGTNPGRVRFAAVLLIVPLCAVSVAAAGNIAFVGLIIPHIMRRIFGLDYRLIMPFSMLGGSLLLVWADIAARMINSPYETPIGLFTSLMGVPFFLYLVRKENG